MAHTNQDQLLQRVRKLLAKAEDPGVTEAEAEAYNTKAAELIAQYGIDQALLAAHGKTTDAIETTTVPIDNPYSHDKAALLHSIAVPLRCRGIQYSSGKSVSKVIVLGFASDLQRVELLYTSLLMQATTQLVRIQPYPGESTAAYRRTWMAGFGNAVYKRLRDAEHRAAHNDTNNDSRSSTELVLLDRNQQVENAFEQHFPHTRKAGKRHLSGTGYRDGHHAGQTASLNTTGIGGNRKSLTR
jgi:hypothetical protein